MENEELKKQIDELMRLFKIAISKYPPDSIPGINGMQLEQLKVFLNDYENMKDEISMDMMSQMDNTMARNMLDMLIKRLRDQLGDDAREPEIVSLENIIEKKERESSTMPASERYDYLIKSIDENLSNPNLSTEEIDALLDKRSSLIKEKMQQAALNKTIESNTHLSTDTNLLK